MLSYDPDCTFSKIHNTELCMFVASSMIRYYDALIATNWSQKWEIELYEQEKQQYKFYDV